MKRDSLALLLAVLVFQLVRSKATVACSTANGNRIYCERMSWKGCYYAPSDGTCRKQASCGLPAVMFVDSDLTESQKKERVVTMGCHATGGGDIVTVVPDATTCDYFNDFGVPYTQRLKLCTALRNCEFYASRCIPHRNYHAQYANNNELACVQYGTASYDPSGRCDPASVVEGAFCSGQSKNECGNGCSWNSLAGKCFSNTGYKASPVTIQEFCTTKTSALDRKHDQYFSSDTAPNGTMAKVEEECCAKGSLCVFYETSGGAERCGTNGVHVCPYQYNETACGEHEVCEWKDEKCKVLLGGTSDYDTGPGTEDGNVDDHTSVPDFNADIRLRDWMYDSNHQRVVGTVDVPLHWYPGDPFSYHFTFGPRTAHVGIDDRRCRSYLDDFYVPSTLPVNETYLQRIKDTLDLYHDFKNLPEQNAFMPIHADSIVKAVSFRPASDFSDNRNRLSYEFFIDLSKVLTHCSHLGVKTERLGNTSETYTLPFNFYAINKDAHETKVPFTITVTPSLSVDTVVVSANPTAYQFSARVAAVAAVTNETEVGSCPEGMTALDITYRLSYTLLPKPKNLTAIGPISAADVTVDGPDVSCFQSTVRRVSIRGDTKNDECVDNYCSTTVILRTSCYATNNNPEFFLRCPGNTPTVIPQYGFRVKTHTCKRVNGQPTDDCSAVLGSESVLSSIRYRLGNDPLDFESDMRMIAGLLRTPTSGLDEMVHFLTTDGVVGETPKADFIGDQLSVVLTLDSTPRRKLFYLTLDPDVSNVAAYDEDRVLIEACRAESLSALSATGIVTHYPWALDREPRLGVTYGELIGIDGFSLRVKSLQAACPGVHSVDITLRAASFRHDQGRAVGLPPSSTTPASKKESVQVQQAQERTGLFSLLSAVAKPRVYEDAVEDTGFTHVEYSKSKVTIILPAAYDRGTSSSATAFYVTGTIVGVVLLLAASASWIIVYRRKMFARKYEMVAPDSA